MIIWLYSKLGGRPKLKLLIFALILLDAIIGPMLIGLELKYLKEYIW